jgi:hypothetical protein
MSLSSSETFLGTSSLICASKDAIFCCAGIWVSSVPSFAFESSSTSPELLLQLELDCSRFGLLKLWAHSTFRLYLRLWSPPKHNFPTTSLELN